MKVTFDYVKIVFNIFMGKEIWYNRIMKTDIETLRKRGFLTNTEAEPFFLYSKDELLELLNDKEAINRTAALFILRNFVEINELDSILLEMLVKEKALYTKLEICNILTTGNEITIKRMIPYIGTIRGNQYHSLPEKGSKKKSYPLPRDIIARTMAKMDPIYFPVILNIIDHEEIHVVGEVIDAIGWQVFYHQELATDDNYQVILKTLKCFDGNELMMWKLITCLSAFDQSEDYLKTIKTDIAVIQKEIQRSIDLINRRKKTSKFIKS